MIEMIVKVGGVEVGNVEIDRIHGISHDYDQWHSYDVALRLHNVDKSRHLAVVDHRYGDEWPVLVKKAIDAVLATGDLDRICRRAYG